MTRSEQPEPRLQATMYSRMSSETSASAVCNVQEELMSMITNRIIPDMAKFLCCRCGEILSFIGDPLQQCPGCETSFHVSISTLIGVAARALQNSEDRGRNITISSTDSDEEKLHWMSQLLSSILTLLQNQTELQLENLNSGEQAD